MRAPTAFIITASVFGVAQPPYVNPSRVSSSERPGACMTPSSVTWLITTTLLIGSAPPIRRLLSAYGQVPSPVKTDRPREHHLPMPLAPATGAPEQSCRWRELNRHLPRLVTPPGGPMRSARR